MNASVLGQTDGVIQRSTGTISPSGETDTLRGGQSSTGRQPSLPASASSSPAYGTVSHSLSKLAFPMSNWGRFGIGPETGVWDIFTGARLPIGIFPRGSDEVFIYKGAIWIGGIVGIDTLVSTGADMDLADREFTPDVSPYGKPLHRSTLDPYSTESWGAVSEDDYIMEYTDTTAPNNPFPSQDAIDKRQHKPLGVKVTQRSYSWSYDYAEDIVFFNTTVKNIGKKKIKKMYFGVFMDLDIRLPGEQDFSRMSGSSSGQPKEPTGGRDDLTGYIYDYDAPYTDQQCHFLDTVRLGYTLDRHGKGNFLTGTFLVPGSVGVRFLRPPLASERMAFNWWVPNYDPERDYGPQKRENLRNMGAGLGAPRGDRNKYAVMSNGETDPDQFQLATIPSSDPVWVTPGESMANILSVGGDGQMVISIGPYDLDPGASIDVPWAMIGCENFQVDPVNFSYHLYWRYEPDIYRNNLNLPAFVKNASWAARIYDNPGIDSDDDGYAGKTRICVYDSSIVDGHWQPTVAETTYYEGDSYADWKASAPPPAPTVWAIPQLDGLRIRFNGYRSETSRDFLSGVNDFEGYRVYYGRDARATSLVTAASYDRENYDIWVYNLKKVPKPDFELAGFPVTMQELRCRFGRGTDPCEDSLFDPLSYTSQQPWVDVRFPNDSIFYFSKHDYNASELGETTPIRKRFPDEPPPSTPPTQDQYTDDGYLKYYEYVCDVEGLLPTVPYYVNVTAFDFGSPKAGLQPLESSREIGARSAYPMADSNQLSSTLAPVYIYPNPYRIDGNYRAEYYEGLGESNRIADRVRAVHFVNVPAKCTIRIYTLDGDLVKQIDHDVSPSDPKCTYETWNMITRNTEMIVSGLYYWTVEDEYGKVQIGKLAVIM